MCPENLFLKHIFSTEYLEIKEEERNTSNPVKCRHFVQINVIFNFM